MVGYCVVFYVERVLFDVHGEGHAHCQHSNVYSHSRYGRGFILISWGGVLRKRHGAFIKIEFMEII